MNKSIPEKSFAIGDNWVIINISASCNQSQDSQVCVLSIIYTGWGERWARLILKVPVGYHVFSSLLFIICPSTITAAVRPVTTSNWKEYDDHGDAVRMVEMKARDIPVSVILIGEERREEKRSRRPMDHGRKGGNLNQRPLAEILRARNCFASQRRVINKQVRRKEVEDSRLKRVNVRLERVSRAHWVEGRE